MNIYLANFPFSTTETELKELFSTYGIVDKVKIIKDQVTEKSRGFGFVEMINREDGIKAISALHETKFQGRQLVVNEARELKR